MIMGKTCMSEDKVGAYIIINSVPFLPPHLYFFLSISSALFFIIFLLLSKNVNHCL